MGQARRDPEESQNSEPGDGAGGSDPGATTLAPASAAGPILFQAARIRAGDSSSPESEETLSPDEAAPAHRDEGPKLPVVDPRSYRITGEVAKGGIGRILRARDERLDRPVALKELLTSAGLVAEDRFVREALLTARLQHPSIVPLYEAGRWPSGEPFYAMKYVSGRSLAEVIAERETLDQRLALLHHVVAVAEAMAYAHSERIIHRDLKPANVLVGAFGETVVIDWGLAKDLSVGARTSLPPPPLDGAAAEDAEAPSSKALTMLGAIMGTAAYMPPEQATGKIVDERADVYALGAILYHLLAGVGPYDGDSSASILREVIAGPPPPIEGKQKGIPEDLSAIVGKAMARDPAARYPTAKELSEDLRRFQTGQIVGAHKYSRMERLRRFVRRYRVAVAAGASALAVFVLGASLTVRHNVSQRQRAEQGEAAAILAQREAVQHADDLTLVQARAAAESDPNEAMAWLKSLSPGFDRWAEARLIAADADARGIATVLRGHEAAVNDASFSPDGKALVTASDDHTARLWDVATGKSRVLSGHADEVWVSAFSPRGEVIVTAGKDKTIRVWSRAGELRRVITGHAREVTSIAFRDEDTIVASDLDHATIIWDLRTGQGKRLPGKAFFKGDPISPDRKRIALFGDDGAIFVHDLERDRTEQIPAAERGLAVLIFTRDGKALLGRSHDGSLRRWDLATGKAELLVGPVRGATVHDVRDGFSLSGAGAELAMIGTGSTLRVWDLARGSLKILDDHQGMLTAVAASHDGALIAAGARDQAVHLWDLSRGVSTILRGFDDAVGAVAFSPDDKLLAATGSDHTVRLFAVKATSHRTVQGQGAPMHALAFSSDGSRLVAGGEDGKLRLIDIAARQSVPIADVGAAIRHATFAPDGKLIAADDAAGIVRVWELDGRPAWIIEGALEARAQATFSSDGRLLAFPGRAGAVQVLELASGTQRTLTGPDRPSDCIAFSPDSRFLASGEEDGAIRVWDLSSDESRVFSGHEGAVTAIAFSPDGRTLASGGDDHTLRLWDVESGQGRRLDAGGRGIAQIAFSRDGATIITRDRDENGVRRWDASTGEQRGVLRGHTGVVEHFALSPDERRMATASADGTARVWDLRSGESRVLEGHTGAVWETAFSPDGKLIASAGDDGTVRVWTDDLPEDGPALRAWIAAATPDTIDLYHHAPRALRNRP